MERVLYRRIYGSGGKKILVLHGWMHSARIYHLLAERLSGEHTVHLLDLPGFGGSSHIHLDRPTIAKLADWVEPYLEREQFDLVVAHSLGGAVLLRLLDRGAPMGAAALLSPAYLGLRGWSYDSRSVGLIHKALEWEAKLPAPVAAPLIRVASLMTITHIYQVNKTVVEDARRAHIPTAQALFRQLVEDRWRIAGPVNYCGVHLLAGGRDRVIPLQHLEQLGRDLGSELTILARTGHTPMVENLPLLLAYLQGLLQEGDTPV